MLDSDKLTPGELDGYAMHAFKYGACGALALAIHDATGWRIVGITDSHNVESRRLGGGSCMHWAVMHPSGQLLDVDGLHDPDEMTAQYDAEADDEEAAWGIGSRADIEEWYIENQGEPIPVSLAATFVDSILEQIQVSSLRR